jgi:very-short-patch-repair endonuclease
MRRAPTEPERRLWQALRAGQTGLKFRRQAAVEQRILDFLCPAKGLAIEIDGITHDARVDERRDAALLRDHGLTTLRFTNEEVMGNLEGC